MNVGVVQEIPPTLEGGNNNSIIIAFIATHPWMYWWAREFPHYSEGGLNGRSRKRWGTMCIVFYERIDPQNARRYLSWQTRKSVSPHYRLFVMAFVLGEENP